MTKPTLNAEFPPDPLLEAVPALVEALPPHPVIDTITIMDARAKHKIFVTFFILVPPFSLSKAICINVTAVQVILLNSSGLNNSLFSSTLNHFAQNEHYLFMNL